MRYTKEQLNAMSNDELILTVLNERAGGLNPYTPLAAKLFKARAEVEARIEQAKMPDQVSERYRVGEAFGQEFPFCVVDEGVRTYLSADDSDPACWCRDEDDCFILFRTREEAQYEVNLYNRASKYGLKPYETNFVNGFNHTGNRESTIYSIEEVMAQLSPYSESVSDVKMWEALSTTVVKLRYMDDATWEKIRFHVVFDDEDRETVRDYIKGPMEKDELTHALSILLNSGHAYEEDEEDIACILYRLKLMDSDDYARFKAFVWDCEASNTQPEHGENTEREADADAPSVSIVVTIENGLVTDGFFQSGIHGLQVNVSVIDLDADTDKDDFRRKEEALKEIQKTYEHFYIL